MTAIAWIGSAGGPLICASNTVATGWRGARPGSEIGAKSDYERACETSDYVSVVACASSQVLILGDDPLQTSFVRLANGVAIARWVSCASAGEAEAALAGIPDSLPRLEEEKFFTAQSGRLVLFDSACAQMVAPLQLALDIDPGSYLVSTERYVKPGVFEFLVHRFKPAASMT